MKKYTASMAMFDGACTRRYDLERRWAPGPRACWIGLNPSLAGAIDDDATIRKEVGFSKRWGMGALVKVNLGSLISTKPTDLDLTRWVGDEDDHYIVKHTRRAACDLIVIGWGDLPAWARRRSFVVLDLLPRDTMLYCVGLTKSGAPRHPSRAPYIDAPRFLTRTPC